MAQSLGARRGGNIGNPYPAHLGQGVGFQCANKLRRVFGVVPRGTVDSMDRAGCFLKGQHSLGVFLGL